MSHAETTANATSIWAGDQPAADPADLLRAGESRAAAGLLDEAHEIFAAALAAQRASRRPPAEQADTLAAMALLRQRGGSPAAALAAAEQALALVPAHSTALTLALDIVRRRGDAVSAIALIKAALPYVAAERHCPLLRELVEHASDARDHDTLVSAMAALAEREAKPARRGKLFAEAAALARDRVSVARAVVCFERALDAFFAPGCELLDRDRAACWAPFGELDRMLSRAQDWRTLERCYRAMIKRLTPGAPELGQLWHRLGEIYRRHLGYKASALHSFEVAASLDDGRLTNHRVLIDLYAEMGDEDVDKIAQRRRRLLVDEPFNPDHYRALFSLASRRGQSDAAFCAARALCFLDSARPAEEALYRRLRPGHVVWPRAPMREELWASLRHSDEDPLVSRIFGAVAQAIAFGRALPPRKLRVADDRSDQFDYLRHAYQAASHVLGHAAPTLCIDPALEGDVVLANMRRGNRLQPTYVAGRHLYAGQSSGHIAYTLTRALTYARPQYFLRLLLSERGELAAAFDAALAASRAPSNPATSAGFAAALASHLDPAWRAQLTGAVRMLFERGDVANIERWGRAVDALARRLVLLVCGELDIAAAGLAREPLFATTARHEQRLADLLVHSVSAEHLAARAELGMAVAG
jgi:tetratricopeptide (TPR) repeat protein